MNLHGMNGNGYTRRVICIRVGICRCTRIRICISTHTPPSPLKKKQTRTLNSLCTAMGLTLKNAHIADDQIYQRIFGNPHFVAFLIVSIYIGCFIR